MAEAGEGQWRRGLGCEPGCPAVGKRLPDSCGLLRGRLGEWLPPLRGITRTLPAQVLPASTEGGLLRRLNGLAAGPDASVYFAENQAVGQSIPRKGSCPPWRVASRCPSAPRYPASAHM
jgi:hypothetical protein